MEVRLADCAGFCFGVKRAVDTVYEQIKLGKTIYTYGPIVHNDEVVRDLIEKGVRVVESKEELKLLQEGSVIIRAHGVSKEIYRILEEQTLEVIDATCPFVKRIHKIVEKASEEGDHIIIIGNAGHPEVEGIMGWCKAPVYVLDSVEQAENITLDEGVRYCVVAQTTFNYNKFHSMVEIFKKRMYNISVVNTICNATEDRQRAAKALATVADAMIVIGGRHSSNTQKLYEICKEECDNTYFIQTLEDLHLELPKSATLVGITAGASTPNKLIEEVQNYVRFNF